jgi:hypothetical protein
VTHGPRWLVIVLLAAAGAMLALSAGSNPASAATYVYDDGETPTAATGATSSCITGYQVVRVELERDGACNRGYDDRSNLASASARLGGYRLAPQTTLYRAVSRAEEDDIAAFRGFRAGPNSYEGKLFATTAEDAARYGRINDALTPGGEPFHIVQTRVPTSLANSFERLTMDSMQAVHVAEGQLDALNAAGRWRIWDWVPWVGKPGAGL